MPQRTDYPASRTLRLTGLAWCLAAGWMTGAWAQSGTGLKIASLPPEPMMQLTTPMVAQVAAAAPVAHPALVAVHVGEFPCFDKIKVTVQLDPRLEEHYHVFLGKKKYHMHRVVTSTGALRLEDSAEGVMWLQLGNKSMLMNTRQGRRLADECMSTEQVRVAEALKSQPATELIK